MNICEVKDFLLNDNKKYLLRFYTHIYFFNQTTSNLYLGQTIIKNIDHCYFGLSPMSFDCLNEGINNLNILKENGLIDKKIFSFDMWNIYPDSISTNFF